MRLSRSRRSRTTPEATIPASGRARWWERDLGGLPVWGAALAVVAAGAMLVGASTLRPSTQEAADAEPVVLLLGDSYTAGVGASDRAHSWAGIVASDEGWRVRNLARGGTGYESTVEGDSAAAACGRSACPSFGQMAAEGAALLPDIVVVSGGRNDIGDDAAPGAVRAFFADLASAYPHSRIYVTNVLWHQDAPESVDALSAVVRAEAERAGATVLDIGQPLASDAEMLAPDGIHPSDAGHAAIADAVLAQLP